MKAKSIFTKGLALVCAGMMLITSFSGCGKTEETAAQSTVAATAVESSTAVDTTSKEKTYDTKLTFTMNAIDADKAGKDDNGNPDPTFEWLKKKFNFDIEWIPCTWSDYFLEKPRIWFASGDQPDLMFLDVAPSRFADFLKWNEQGQFRPYENYEQYANIKAAMDKAVNGKKFIVDGKLIAFPSFIDSIKYDFTCASNNAIFRADWADAVGKRQPNDIYTWDQWEDLVRTVVEQDPGKTGKTIGMATQDWMFPGKMPYIDLNTDLQGYKKVDGKWVWGPSLPASLEIIQKTKKLYDDGLIDKDQILIKSKDDVLGKFYANKLFAYMGGGGLPNNFDEIGQGLKKAIPEIDPSKAIGNALIKGVTGKILCGQSSDHWTETAMSKNLSDEKAERWMDILDYMVSEEGYYMRNFGTPGTDWVKEGDKINVKWTEAPTGLKWGNAWQWAVRAGCSDIIQQENPLYPAWTQEASKKVYEIAKTEDALVIPFNTELAYFDGPNYKKIGSLDKPILEKIAVLMTLKADKVEAEWNKFVKENEPKVAPVIEELNANFK